MIEYLIPGLLGAFGLVLLFWDKLSAFFNKPKPEPPAPPIEPLFPTDETARKIALLELLLDLRAELQKCDGCAEAIDSVLVPAVLKGGDHAHE